MSYGAQKMISERNRRALRRAEARKRNKKPPSLLEHAMQQIKKLKSEVRRLKKELKYSDQKRQEYLNALPSED